MLYASNGRLSLINSTFLEFSPDKLFTINQMGGDFFLMSVDVYNNVQYSTDSFYCNHFIIITGNCLPDIFNVTTIYVNPKILKTAYFYISDISGMYDPLFDTYYLYITDIYTGLILIKITSDFTINDPVVLSSTNNYVSVIKCGQFLYAASISSQIDKFFLEN